MTAVSISPRAAYPVGKIAIAGVAAILLSIAANLIVRAVGKAIVDMPADFNPLATWQPIVIFSTLFILIATLVWGFITRRSVTPERTFTIVAVVGLLVSLIPNVFMLLSPESFAIMGTATSGAALTLVVMHIVSGLITVPTLTRLSRA